jgi:uncharacterized tellurite resistance protein B-like protein
MADDPDLLVAMAKLMAVDGHLHEQEARMLTQMAASRGVPVSRVQQAIASGEAGTATIELPDDPQDQRAFVEHMVRGALVDGQISKGEHALLVDVATRLGWSAKDLDLVIKQQRAALYQQAKAILRDPDAS